MVTNTPRRFYRKYNDLSNQRESPANNSIKINIGTKKIGQIALVIYIYRSR
jgi:hypothetical protein